VGAFTLGWDALQMHRYAIAAGYDRAETSRSRPSLTNCAVSGRPSRFWRVRTRTANPQRSTIGLPFRSIAHLNQFDLAPRIWHDSAFLSRLDFDWLFSNEHAYRSV